MRRRYTLPPPFEISRQHGCRANQGRPPVGRTRSSGAATPSPDTNDKARILLISGSAHGAGEDQSVLAIDTRRRTPCCSDPGTRTRLGLYLLDPLP